MKKRELEHLLKNEIENNVPFVLPEVLKTPCKVEEVVETAKKVEKPYFQFRYMYASLVILAILVVGLGALIPNTKSGGIMSGGSVVAEEYEVYTTVTTSDTVVSMTTDESGLVLSVVINGISQPVVVGKNVEDAVEYIVEVLDTANTLDSDIVLDIESKNSYNPNADIEDITTLFKTALYNKGINL